MISKSVFSQSKNYTKIEEQFLNFVNNFKSSISTTHAQYFKKQLEAFNENLTEYLKGGYGLSFNELNELRVMKKNTSVFEDFYATMGFDDNKSTCSMKDIRIVNEYFPEIEFSLIKSSEKFVNIYKIKIDQYNVFVARHTDRAFDKKINYSCKFNNQIKTGNMGLPYKCIRKIIDNASNNFTQLLNPIILNTENIASIGSLSSCTSE